VHDTGLGARLFHRREAYSIAILLQEGLEALKQSFKTQVFATDIDSRAIAPPAPASTPPALPPTSRPSGWRASSRRRIGSGAYHVHKGIRDMLVFSEQDLTKDPPFSRLDLISCRNLLIYMGGELQKKLIPCSTTR